MFLLSCFSCVRLCVTLCRLPGSSVHGILQARILDCHFLLQGIFPTQGLNLHLLHWQVGPLPLSHQGSSSLPLPESHIIEITQYVAFSDWLLSISNVHLSFHYGFSWLDNPFLLARNNVTWSRCTTVYQSTHLLKNIIIISKIWEL